MSLDEIITSTKRTRGGGRGRGGRGTTRGAAGGRGGRGAGVRTSGGRPAGGVRRGAVTGGQQRFRTRPRPSGNADGVWTHDKFQDSNVGGIRKAGIRAVGGGGGGPGSAKITISNLHYGVSDADIIELFGEVGNIRYASVHYDRSGRSMGKADVTFDRRVDAQAAIQQYDGVPLDGRPMSISWANSAATTQQQVSPRGGGLRQIQGKRIQRTSGGGGGGFRGGRGGRGRGGGRGARQGGSTKAPTAEELDAELDAYVSQNQK